MPYQFTYPRPHQLIIQKSTGSLIIRLFQRMIGLIITSMIIFAFIFVFFGLRFDYIYSSPLMLLIPASALVLLGLVYTVYSELQTRHPFLVNGETRTIRYNEENIVTGEIDRVVIERFTTGSGRNRRTRYRLKVGTSEQSTKILDDFPKYKTALYLADEIAEVLMVQVRSV